MSKLSEVKAKLTGLWDQIAESEAAQQLKSKYDELDAQTKLYVNLGGAGVFLLIILITVFSGISKVNTVKRDMDEREALIGYLQRSADNLKQLKAQQEAMRGDKDINSPLNTFIENIGGNSGLNTEKIEIAAERPGKEMKEAKEILADVKMNQVNIRQVTRFLFNLTDQGSPRNLYIRDLTVDTKSDPTGYMDGQFTVATYKAK